MDSNALTPVTIEIYKSVFEYYEDFQTEQSISTNMLPEFIQQNYVKIYVGALMKILINVKSIIVFVSGPYVSFYECRFSPSSIIKLFITYEDKEYECFAWYQISQYFLLQNISDNRSQKFEYF